MSRSVPDYFTRPDFAVAVRGYDRAQVDDYLRRVREWLDEAEARSAATEDSNASLSHKVAELEAMVATLEERIGLPAGESMSAFGERLGSVMQSAIDAAEGLRAEAEREARQRLEASTAEAQEIVGRAQTEADGLVQRARDKERVITESIDDLRAKREAALAEIARLYGHLSALLTLPEPTPTADGGPEVSAAVDETAVLFVPAEPAGDDSVLEDAPEEQGEGHVDEPMADGEQDTASTDESQRAPVLVTSAPTMVQATVRPAGR